MDSTLMIAAAAFAATGACAGLFAGLLGVGGGMIMVPVLVFLLPGFGIDHAVVAQVAVGTSLACISFISINSARAHNRRDAVRWAMVLRMAPGLVLGAWLGAAVAHLLPSLLLQRIVGIAALAVAAKMITGVGVAARQNAPSAAVLGSAGGVIGALSSLVGIGGGSLTVPFLSWAGLLMQRAVGTSAACGMPIAWAGAIGYVVAGWGAHGAGSLALGYVNLPAVAGIVIGSLAFTPLGAALAHRLPAQTLRRAFALLLAVVGLRMLFG